jgi:hypothetical protein
MLQKLKLNNKFQKTLKLKKFQSPTRTHSRLFLWGWKIYEFRAAKKNAGVVFQVCGGGLIRWNLFQPMWKSAFMRFLHEVSEQNPDDLRTCRFNPCPTRIRKLKFPILVSYYRTQHPFQGATPCENSWSPYYCVSSYLPPHSQPQVLVRTRDLKASCRICR